MITDTHCHIDLFHHAKSVLSDLSDQKISLIAPSMNPDSYNQLCELRDLYPDTIRLIAAGLHPEQIHSDETVQKAIALAEIAPAIGEVGLPCYERPVTDRDIQLLEQFCRIASKRNVGMILHAVHAQAPIALDLLVKHQVQRAVFHWLKADSATVERIVESGYYVSVTPEVIHRERDQQLLKQIPKEQLLLETDGPFPLRGPFEGIRNMPTLVIESAHLVSIHYGLSMDEWWDQHEDNIHRLFGV